MTIGDIKWAQRNGAPPSLFTTAPPGESSISLLRVQFRDAAYLSGTSRHHLVFLQMSPAVRFECRMGERRLIHEPGLGALAICPAGMDYSAESDMDVDALVIAVDPNYLKLTAAEENAAGAQLTERLSGYDTGLFDLARRLAAETMSAHPNGPLFWSELGDAMLQRLVADHTSAAQLSSRGTLDPATLNRIRDYVATHLAEPIEVAALADLAGRSPFHFSRLFVRAVGMTPHRYVVRLRLQAAVERIKHGRSGLADIAAETGFSDQSHLSRWIRRVYGAAPSELVA
jgi:AraC family transcriptional regulator